MTTRYWYIPLLMGVALLAAACAGPRAGTFATPEEAVQALVESTENAARAEELLGPGGFDVLKSGDDVADREDIVAVKGLILQRVAFKDSGEGRKIALLGHDAWELPIPLVSEGERWRFDVEAGKEEVLNRRVGRNELLTIATLHAGVDAQREYARQGRDGNAPAYARKWFSDPGKQDGLYWPVPEGELESPLGLLVAAAAAEGYQRSDERPVPYHGYFYRILTAQGANAPGGAKGYVDAAGLMTGGFALLAWPATYGNSGIMTFQVNHLGIVFQRDLGPDTEQEAQRITAFDPDASWEPTGD
ncbi:MAG: DUF2950 domain-containing protein [Planctomycetota bacterium]